MSEEQTFSSPGEVTVDGLVEFFANQAQALAQAGVPRERISEALMVLGVRCEVAAHGTAKVAVRLAAAAHALTVLAEEVARQPEGSPTAH